METGTYEVRIRGEASLAERAVDYQNAVAAPRKSAADYIPDLRPSLTTCGLLRLGITGRRSAAHEAASRAGSCPVAPNRGLKKCFSAATLGKNSPPIVENLSHRKQPIATFSQNLTGQTALPPRLYGPL